MAYNPYVFVIFSYSIKPAQKPKLLIQEVVLWQRTLIVGHKGREYAGTPRNNVKSDSVNIAIPLKSLFCAIEYFGWLNECFFSGNKGVSMFESK